MGEGTRVVDYGKDIADLRAVVKQLQSDVIGLEQMVARLSRGSLFGPLTFGDSPAMIDGFQGKYNY